MKCLKKIFILTFLICALYSSIIHAYSSTSIYHHKESATSTGYSEVTDYVIFNQLLDLNNINIKFTQNDNQYIFDISANASLNVCTYKNTYPIINSRNGGVGPLLYKTNNFGNAFEIYESSIHPFIDFIYGTVYTNEYVRKGSPYIYLYDYRYKQVASDKITNQSETFSNDGGNFYVCPNIRNSSSGRTYNYTYARRYPACYNPSGITLLSNNSYLYTDNADENIYYVFRAKIAITKSKIDELRYVCFGNAYVVSKDTVIRDLEHTMEGISVCTNTIDLKEYVNCEHKWNMRIKDSSNHIIYCENCEWEKEEPHSLDYEYDGILDNICTCSYINKVKYYYEINDDFTGEAIEICDVDSEYKKHKFQSKTGYKFNWYDKYEKQLLNSNKLSTKSNLIKTFFVATCSEFDEVANNKSTIYKSNVTPIKYIIKYSNNNKKKLKIDETIDEQIVNYDEEVKLKDNIYCKGYVFSGWALNENNKKADFTAGEKIKNLTTEDNKAYTLYPLYDELDFSIKYSSGSGKFADGSSEKVINYKYFDDKELEKPVIKNPESYFLYYIDDDGNKFYTLNDIKNYVEKNGKNNTNINIRAVIGTNQYGRPERTEPGGITPTASNSAIEINAKSTIVESETISYVEESIDINNYLINETLKKTNYITKKQKNEKQNMKDDENISTMSDVNGGVKKASISYIGFSGPKKPINNFNYKLLMIKYLFGKYKFIFISISLLIMLIIAIYEVYILKHFICTKK